MMELITLVEHATQGDVRALGHLVTEHWRFVYTMCLSQVGQAADAEDLTQEVFMQVSQGLADLREPDKFLPWLRQVVRNVCRMWRRRQRTTPEPLDTMAELDDPTAAVRFRRAELAEIVRGMLAQVSPKSREVLALHYLAGYSEAEMAVALGLSPATIKSRLREGREQAKRTLLPVVRELLALQMKPGCGCPLSQQTAERVMVGYGKRGCNCHETHAIGTAARRAQSPATLPVRATTPCDTMPLLGTRSSRVGGDSRCRWPRRSRIWRWQYASSVDSWSVLPRSQRATRLTISW